MADIANGNLSGGAVLIYDVKLPDHRFPEPHGPWIEPYEIRVESIRRNDGVAFVCDCLMPPGIAGPPLRHYSFPNRWWAANVALNMDGSLRPHFGANQSHCFDCDITTPHFEAFGALCNIDLKLDVFVRSDGRAHVVTDRDHFEDAIARGFIDEHDRQGAEEGLAELLRLIESGDLIDLLETICALQPVDDAGEVRVLDHRPDTASLDHWRAIRER